MTSTETALSVHRSFWLIAIVGLVWNAMGAANFIFQLDPEVIASYRESEQAIIRDRPIWATAGFATAVFGGTIGCILLLLKRSLAKYLFLASLAGAILAAIHAIGTNASFSVGEAVGILLMPVAVAAFLVWYTGFATRKGWLHAT